MNKQGRQERPPTDPQDTLTGLNSTIKKAKNKSPSSKSRRKHLLCGFFLVFDFFSFFGEGYSLWVS